MKLQNATSKDETIIRAHSLYFFFLTAIWLYHGQLTNPMLIAAFVHVRPEGHQEPRNEVRSLSPAERLAGFEPGNLLILIETP